MDVLLVLLILSAGGFIVFKWVNLTFFNDSHGKCYDEQERTGNACFGQCSGLAGGDKSSNYLQSMCMDCPCFNPGITIEDLEKILNSEEDIK